MQEQERVTASQERVIAYYENLAVEKHARLAIFVGRYGTVGYINRAWPKVTQREVLALGDIVSIVAYGKVRRLFKKGD